MDIYQVKFGDYSLGNQRMGMRKKEEKKEEKVLEQQQNLKSVADADDVMGAMNLAGMVNQIQIQQVKPKNINPMDYLSQDRVDDIEAMMEEFDNGVSSIANVIAEEFGNSLQEDKINELAAKIYANE